MVIAGNYNSIPYKYSKTLFLDSPKKNIITLNNTIKFSGTVPAGFKVTLNGNSVKTNNGQFDFPATIDNLGKKTFLIEFNNDKDTISLERQVIRLKNSKNIVLTQKELAFINTDYVSNAFKNKSLSRRLTKDELAYFLSKITTIEVNANKTISNKNALKYKKEIQDVVDRSIISLDANGNFKSSDSINGIIYLTTVAKSLNLKPSDKDYPELAKYKNKWFYSFLVIGRDQGIINSSSLASISSPLNHAKFIKYSSRINALKSKINDELAFTPTRKRSKKVVKVKPVVKQVNIKITSVTKVSDTVKRVDIKVNTDRAFTYQWKKILPSVDGTASLLVPINQNKITLDFGANAFTQTLPKKIQTKSKTTTLPPIAKVQNKKIEKKTVLPKAPIIVPFADLKNHWVKDIANKLKTSGQLENKQNFNPNQKVTRADLAKYLVSINGVKAKKINRDIRFNDVKKSDSNYSYVQAVVSNRLLNGLNKNQFGLTNNVTKIQALVAVSRLLPDVDVSKVELPYSDISKYKWATKSLKKAYFYKVLSPSKTFNPNKEVSKAEVVTLLYKASVI